MKTLVYVDCLEGWQECKLIKTFRERAIVKTPAGTNLNRILKIVSDPNKIVDDGCIYMIKNK